MTQHLLVPCISKCCAVCVKMENKIRSRCYHLILYPSDNKHIEILDLIENNYNYAYILHDKDNIANTGELKKAHWHVILYFDNAKYLNSLAEELGIQPNYIRTEELKKGLEYLIHKNNKDKTQYSIDEVNGPLKDRLNNFLARSIETENTSIMLLFEIINKYEGQLFIENLLPVVLQNNLWSYFRRSQLTWFKLIEEHNRKYHLKK